LNPGRRGGKPATNRLSYGTANYTTMLNDTAISLILKGFSHFHCDKNTVLNYAMSYKTHCHVLSKLLLLQIKEPAVDLGK
jgi:hypothetical protein